MKTKILLMLVLMIAAVQSSFARMLFPDSDTAQSKVELGVEGIQRLCPTGMWDNWVFRDILFDRKTNTVTMFINLNRYVDPNDEKLKKASAADIEDKALWIVANFKEGYEDLIKHPRTMCDGDFMLYLSVGTLFKQMEKDGTKLQIVLLNPEDSNRILGEEPVELTPEQLKEVKPEE